MACKYTYKGITYNSKEEFINQVINPQFLSNQKVRRVMELQSDLFQKGREQSTIAIQGGGNISYIVKQSEYDNNFVIEDNEGNIKAGPFKNKQEAQSRLDKFSDNKGNQFLQLLNKDSNWVTFFIKSIIQDSAKKGYEKVLFPKGETAAKVEGHQIIADQINNINSRIEEINNSISKLDSNLGSDVMEIERLESKLESLEQEKANLKAQGIEKLNPIEGFYEIKVGNILEKQFGKDNVKTITDEFGNQWREIDLSNEKVQEQTSNILFQKIHVQNIEQENGTTSDELEANIVDRTQLKSLEQLMKYYKIKIGNISIKDGQTVYETTDNPYFQENIPTLTKEQAVELFNKTKKEADYAQLAKYFATYFVNEIIEKDATLRVMYNRLESYSGTKPKILIVDDNKRFNPFIQSKNTIIVGLWQLQQYLESGQYSEFTAYENMVQKVAQEESIHLLAEYLMNRATFQNIYSELSKKDISTIKKLYRNEQLTETQIVHEYLRMLIQNKLFGTTTEIEFQKLEKHSKNFLEALLEEIINFFNQIVGNNTNAVIKDVIAFATEANLSPELIQKLKDKVFDNPLTFESNLLSNTTEVYKELYKESSKMLSLPEFSRQAHDIIITLKPYLSNEEIIEKLKCL